LFGRLEQAFPSERLFMDIDNIAPGLDFVQVLNDEVARCDVLIAIIGQGWLAATDETGQRRLDNEDDFVRIEIESALAQKKRVIPVLVNDATMARAAELPEALRAFARCNAVRLTHERFRADVQGLIKSLEQVLVEADAARRADGEASRREAKAKEKAEAERLRQERRRQSPKPREAKPEGPRGGTRPSEASSGLVSWIAGLPSEISWRVPIAVAAILLLGWVLPGQVFTLQGSVGWGVWSLLYAVAGVIVTGVIFILRRRCSEGRSSPFTGSRWSVSWRAPAFRWALGSVLQARSMLIS
jgi:TIR domain